MHRRAAAAAKPPTPPRDRPSPEVATPPNNGDDVVARLRGVWRHTRRPSHRRRSRNRVFIHGLIARTLVATNLEPMEDLPIGWMAGQMRPRRVGNLPSVADERSRDHA